VFLPGTDLSREQAFYHGVACRCPVSLPDPEVHLAQLGGLRVARFGPVHSHGCQDSLSFKPSQLVEDTRWTRLKRDHVQAGGLVFPTRRWVRLIGPGNRSLPFPTTVSLQLTDLRVETK
jgi:hypothetical protein